MQIFRCHCGPQHILENNGDIYFLRGQCIDTLASFKFFLSETSPVVFIFHVD